MVSPGTSEGAGGLETTSLAAQELGDLRHVVSSPWASIFLSCEMGTVAAAPEITLACGAGLPVFLVNLALWVPLFPVELDDL